MPPRAPEMRGKLAESAYEMFARQGFENTSMDAIAAHAKVTKGSLYWHYDSKNALINAACDYYYQKWHRRIRAEITHLSDPMERLEQAVRFCVRSCLVDKKNRSFSSQIFALALHHEEVRRGWSQFYNTFREFYLNLTHAAIGTETMSAFDAECAVDLMLEATEGIKMRALFEPHIILEEERIVQELMNILKDYSPPPRSPATRRKKKGDGMRKLESAAHERV